MMRSLIRQLSFLLVLVLCGRNALASRQRRASNSQSGIRADFVRAMNEATQRKEEAKRQNSLMKRMLTNARLVKNAFHKSPPPSQDERKLGNWNYGYNNYYYNQGDDDDWYQQEQNQQQEEEEEDDAFIDYGGLNLTQYALKYVGCQNIHTFSDDIAADNNVDGTLAMNRFVVFRLCPKESCSNYNEWGCDYNYGEYTMPMEDYLATMQQYHIQQYQEYCQTCQQCMTGTGDFAQDNNNQNNRGLNNEQYYNGGGQYYYYNKNGQYYQSNYGNGDDYNANAAANDDGGNGGGDDYYGAGDDDGGGGGGDDGYQADAYQNQNAYANDDMFQEDDGSNETAYSYSCIYDDVCASYQDACAAEMFTDDNYMANSENYAEYFECSEFDVGGAVSYLGPHCRSDGFTIGIGIYEDEYCSSYIGDMVDMQEVTGEEYDDDYLSPYYPKQCISCTARESYDLMTDDEIENEENEGIYEVCGYLYNQAAKCNRYLGYDSETYEGQYQQEANENDVCNFVASLVENNYDEYGEAYLESPEWELSKWKEINSYKQDFAERASPGQLLALLFSIGLVLSLSMYIVYLRHKLTRRVPWSRGFGSSKAASRAGEISRIGSGITMQRSLSANLEPGYSGSFA